MFFYSKDIEIEDILKPFHIILIQLDEEGCHSSRLNFDGMSNQAIFAHCDHGSVVE